MEDALRLVNTRTTLSNHELARLCEAASLHCLIIMRNQLTPQLLRQHTCFVLNMDENHGDGTHWVALYRRGKTLFYCDSYGTPPPQEQKELASRGGYKLYENAKQVQAVRSKCCGFFALLFLIFMEHGQGTPLHRFNDYLDCFSGSYQEGNDKRVKDLLRAFFA